MASSHRRKGYKRKHRLLIDEIADHANIRRDVVEDVLDGFYDIMVERLINEREFLIKEILSIRAVESKNGIRPELHLQFRAKIALGLKRLLQRTEQEPDLRVDRHNWRDLSAALRPSAKQRADSMDLSEFLRDDDEDL